MHTVQLLLKPTTYEREEMERRFHALSHIHNVCIKHMRKLLKMKNIWRGGRSMGS